jgi:hypothetical protein
MYFNSTCGNWFWGAQAPLGAVDPASKTSLKLALTTGAAASVSAEIDARSVHARLDCGADAHVAPLTQLRAAAAELAKTQDRLTVRCQYCLWRPLW